MGYLEVIVTDGAVAAWPLDENDATAVYADVIGSLDATLNHGTTADHAGPGIIPAVGASPLLVGTGTLDTAATEVLAVTAHGAVLEVGSGDFALEVWAVLTLDPAAVAGVPVGLVAADLSSYHLGLLNGDAAGGDADKLALQDALSNSCETPPDYGDGLLHHMVFTRRSGDHVILVDGVEIVAITPASPSSVAADATLHLLGVSYDALLPGYAVWCIAGAAAWVAFYDVALSEAQAAAHFAAGQIAPAGVMGAAPAAPDGFAGPWVASTQTVTMGTAPARAFFPGPSVIQPDLPAPPDFLPRVTAGVYTRAGALVAALADSWGRTWQDRHNEVGSGQLKLANDDPDLALVDYSHVIRFDLDGEARFGCLVEHIDTVAITTEEEVGEVSTLGGRGRMAVLEEAVMEPYGGEARSQFQSDRLFCFAAPELDDSAWTAVNHRVQALNPDDDPGSHNTVPQKWPDPDALKIWHSWPIGSRSTPVGDVYMRRHFTTSSSEGVATYRVFATADDGYEVWIDGQLIMGEVTPFMWNETADTEVVLDDGPHVIALKGTNLDFGDNVAWCMASVYALGDGGATLASVVVHTDASWVGVGYPAVPPGFTPAHVLRLLVEEAQTRGALLDLVLAFDDTADTDGVAWPITSDLAFEVGMDLLSILKQLCETYMDAAMAAGSFTLYGWVSRGAVTAVTLQRGLNLTGLQFTGEA